MFFDNLKNVYLTINPSVILNKLNIGAILVKSSDKTVVLNNTEAFVTCLCTGENSIEQIINQVVEQYNLDDTDEIYSKSILELLENLTKENFLFISRRKIRLEQVDYLRNINNFIDENEDYLLPQNLVGITLNIIDNCPLQCTYCIADASEIQPELNMLSFSKIKELLDESKSLGARILTLTGGEPILHPNIFDIIKYAYDIGFYKVLTSTKATLITKDVALKLRQAGLKEIQVSIDSNDAEIYEKLVGKTNTYSKMIQGLYNLMYFGFNVQVKAVVTINNINYVPQLCEDMLYNGVHNISAEIVIPTGKAVKDMMPSQTQINNLEDKLKIIQEKRNLNYEILKYREFGKPGKCSGAISSIAIFSNGDVALCERIRPLLGKIDEIKLGNIYKDTLTEIWVSEKINIFRKLKNDSDTCKQCDQVKYCLGGCILNSWVKFNTWNAPDPLCSKVYEKSSTLKGLM